MNYEKITIFAVFVFSIFYFLFSIAAPLLAVEEGFVRCDPTKRITEPGSCNLCELLHSAQIIVRWFTTISIPLGIAFIVYGAVVIMIAGGSTEQVQKGRQIITSAVWGVIIVLGAWILINTILTQFTAGNIGEKLKNWYEIKC